MRYVYLLAALAFGAAAPIGAQTSGLTVTNYQFVSETRVSVNLYDVTYSATIVNTGAAKGGVTAHGLSVSSAGDLVPGKDTLHFGPVSQNGQVDSIDTFTIRVDRSQTFFFAQLRWTFDVAPSGPQANAGANQTATVGSTVTLNGSGSTNPSGSGTLTYSWTLTSRPSGSLASLTNANTVSPTFVIDKPGTYTAALTVSNGSGSSTASVSITTINSPPVANAGPNQTVAVGSTVTLNGSASSDVDGNPLTYQWTITSKPTSGVASAAVLSSGSAVSPTFVADRAGTYVIQLVVNDGTVNSAPASVTINTSNTQPVANAGTSQVVGVGATVQLNGAGSTDVDGNPLTYQWSLITLPAGSTAVLSNSSIVNPTFVADVSGSYVAQLIVNDGSVNSNPSTVTITTNSTQPPTASAGTGQTVTINSLVTLHGTGTDPQSLPLTYSWSLTSKPAGSTATLAGATTQTPTFTADKPGDYIAQLIVNNGVFSSAPSTVTVTTAAILAPTANAGAAQTISGTGSTVNLSGSGSTDPQSLALTYLWSLSSRPTGSTATLTGATTATPAFVADKVGTYVAQLIVNNGYLASSPVTVTITVNAGPATSIVATSGGGQSANLNSAFGAPLVATVTDAQGNPVSGKTVTFTAPASGASGTFAGSGATATATTNASGVATSPAFTANGISGAYNVVASVVSGSTLTVNFGLTNRTAGPTLTVVSGTPQSVQLRANFPQPLVVRLLDSSSNPVPNATVTFSTSSSNGTAMVFFAQGNNTAVTGADGVATSAGLTSNNSIGTVTVTATAPGVTVPAVFTLNILAGAPDSITYVSGTEQTAPINTVFTSPLVVLVQDSQLNPVQGAMVTFSAPNTPGTPGGTFAGNQNTAVTNAAGQATSALLTANDTTGAFNVVASVSGVATTVQFHFHNDVGLPNKISVTSGSPQTASANAAFSAPLVATVLNGSNQPVVGTTVTFSAPASGASGSFAGGVNTAITNASGVATSALFTANCTVGSYQVSALAAGVSAAAQFQLTNVAGPASSITVSSGNSQSTAVTTAFGSPLAAIVKDSCGSPVSGATVTFTAPTTGALGTFTGGVSTITATTNASGIASAPITAGTVAGAFTVTASVTGVATSASFSLTNNAGPAATITATAGTPQSATINTAFGTLLGVNVKDANNNPVSGVTVTFTAPAQTGASGTFAAGTVTTNASGNATALAFTANSKVGTYTVTASVAGVATPANFSLTNTTGAAASVTITGGDAQSAGVGLAFGSPLQVTVKDAGGNPVNGATVTFAAPASGASATFSPATATTNASGVANSATMTANNTVGTYQVTATVGALAPVSFSLTNLSGPPTTLVIISGTPQSAVVGAAFAAPLVVKLTDAQGNPAAGQTIVFAAPASGASGSFASSSSVQTNASGIATSPVFTANSTPGGPYNVTATFGALPAVNFALTNLTGPPSSVTVSAGNSQHAAVTTAYGTALAVIVKDAGNNPLNNVAVTFTAPASGASGTFAGSVATATVSTNASGIATAPAFTANGTAGAFTVAATVTGVATPANFALTNDPGAPATVTINAGSPQSAVVTNAYATALAAIVKDSSSNPISGVTVTFTAPTTGARGTFTGAVSTITATTNASGIATATITAGTVAGAFNVTAAVTGVATPATFALTNTPGPASAITIVSGTPQSAIINAAFANPLVAVVKDAQGNGISGLTVNFAAPSTGASAAFAGAVTTATTNASGQATSAALTANGTAGTYNVTAAVSGVATTVSFVLTNTPPPPGSIAVAGGSTQSTTQNAAFPAALKALVKDTNNNVLQGATVTFTVPASGSSGTFPGGVTTVTATTDASGIATAPTLTANGTIGSFTAQASVTGVGSTASYSLTINGGGTCTSCLTLASAALGKDLQIAVTLTMPSVAPAGTTVTITSSDPSKVLVTGRPNDVGAGSFSAPVDGLTQASIFIQGLASSGSVTLTAHASGTFNDGVATITLSPSGFVLSGPNGIGNSFQTNSNVSTTLTVNSARLDPTSNGFVEVQPLRAGASASVVVSASPAAQGTITGGTLSFAAGDQAKTATFVAGTPGNAVITAAPPAGFTTPSASANVLLATVATSGITVPDVSVGKNRQTSMVINLAGAAPGSGLAVNLTSSDPTKLTFATGQADAGSGSIVLNVVPGGTHTAIFYVHGLADTGTVTYTASASGFGAAVGTATLTPSGVIIGVGGSYAGGFSTVVGAPATNINVASVQIVNGSEVFQEVAGGQSANVNISLSGSGAGTLSSNTVTIAGGNGGSSVTFTPTAQGGVNISADVPAGSIASSKQAVSATINLPGMSVTGNAGVPVSIGKNLQVPGTVTIGAAAPASGTTITLTSSDPTALLLSTDGTTGGSASITVTIAAGLNTGNFVLQSRSDTGTVSYTATATGYNTGTGQAAMSPSGVALYAPVLFPGFPFAATAGTTVGLAVYPVVMDGTAAGQTLSGGVAGINVTLTSSNTASGTVDSPVTIAPATASTAVTFHAIAAGQGTISVTTPPGYVAGSPALQFFKVN